MKKLILSFALIMAVIVSASAQPAENTVTANKDLGYTKTSIFVQYGYAPIGSFDFWANSIFNKHYPGYPFFEPTIDKMTSWGSATAGASFNFTDLIELWIPFTYSSGKGQYVPDGTYIEPGDRGQNFTDNWYSLTPNVKFNWYHSKSGSFMLYSRVGIGIALATRKVVNTAGTHLDTKCAFAFIASPIGMEVGKNVSFFAEAGLGQTGVINAGVRFKFRKTSKGFNDDGTAKKYNWADRYMDR